LQSKAKTLAIKGPTKDGSRRQKMYRVIFADREIKVMFAVEARGEI